jgi:hypothetical protein
MLQEQDRQKLDGIVQQMTANNEPDQNIQAVVGDFKQKYSNPTNDQQAPTQGGISGYIGQIAAMPGKIGRDYNARTQGAVQAQDKSISGQQSTASGALQTIGEGAGFVGDLITEGLKAFIPSEIKNPIKAGISAVTQTAPVQTILKGYADWKTRHPEAAANLDATVNIGTLIPGLKGAGAITDLAEGGARGTLTTAGKIIEKQALPMSILDHSNFITDLVREPQTAATKIDQVSRTTEVGSGLAKKSIVALNSSESAAKDAVVNLPGVSARNTYQQNFNVIRDANVQAAKDLESNVASNNFVIPRRETISKLNAIKKTLATSPVIVGDAEKTAQKLLDGATQFVNENTSDGVGLLKARKQYDQWVLSQRPSAFDAKAESAFTIANREVRGTLTDILDTNAPNAEVRASLKNQSSLYTAMDNIAPKAASEADSAVGRLFDRVGKILHTKSRIVQGVAMGVGIGGLGAASTFAPAVAWGAGLYLTYKEGRFLLRPEVRVQVGKLLEEYGDKIPTSDKTILQNLYKGAPISLEMRNGSGEVQ